MGWGSARDTRLLTLQCITRTNTNTNARFLHCYCQCCSIVKKTRHDCYIRCHIGLTECSDNNRLIAFLFLPEASCSGVFPSAFFTLTSAPWSRRSRAISSSRRRDARCNGVSWTLFCALTSTPCSNNRRTRQTTASACRFRDHEVILTFWE